jgi:SWI/SNF-related matrix-associated actin-dependent regulator 1 of chromatin subfamily A
MTTTLRKYQRDGVRFIERCGGRAMVCDEMGLGKTLQALSWGHHFLDAEAVKVVVCPAAVKDGWRREAASHLGLRAEVLGGTKPYLRPGDRSPCPLLIVNYDVLSAWLPYLTSLPVEYVILDEIQYVKSPKAARTKAVYLLCEGVEHVVGLSGTPLMNRPAELWPVVHLLRPDLFPSWSHFAWRYCRPERNYWGWTYNGADNLDELHQILTQNLMIRRRKADVLKELPPKQDIVVPVEMSRPKEYELAYRQFVQWLMVRKPEKAVRALKNEALTKIGYLVRLVGELKRDAVASWVKDYLESGEKLALFGVHHEFLRPLHARFPRESVLIDGAVVGPQRQATVDRFAADPRVRVLFGNVVAAGVGMNGIQRATSTVAHGEFPWTPAQTEQATARAHRIGQTKKVTVFHLVVPGTIEEKVLKLNQKKQEILDRTLDGKTGEAFDVFDALVAEIVAENSGRRNGKPVKGRQ